MGKPGQHPCLSCGACCAYFRVRFYWREAEAAEHQPTVPRDLTVDVAPLLRGMSGTTEKSGNRCVALEGRVGARVGCSIYANRPTPCRTFGASYENGKRNPRCDEARASHGLRALTIADWLPPAEERRGASPPL